MLRRTAAFVSLALVLMASGCGLLLDPDPLPGRAPDATAADSGAVDAALDVDAQPDVADADASAPCVAPTGDDVVARWTFDVDPPGMVVDSSDTHDGTIFGSAYAYPPHDPCGLALSFVADPIDRTYVRVPHSSDFDLSLGSVSLRVLIDERRSAGILSRDELGRIEPGHFLIATSDEGHLFARVQTFDQNGYACSDMPLVPGRWYTVDVSFGGLEGLDLYVDGRLQTFTGAILYDSGASSPDLLDCSLDHDGGIAGNTLDLHFGGATNRTARGEPPNTFFGGQLDEIVIRSSRRVP